MNSHEYHLPLFTCPTVGLWAIELINKSYEKALRLVYKDKTNLSFDNSLKKGKLVSSHQGHLSNRNL